MRARRGLILLCLVPGLPQLFFGRERLGLGLAASFTLLLNAALVLSLIWTTGAPPMVTAGLGASAAAFWVVAAAGSWKWLRRRFDRGHAGDSDEWYREALDQYLQRNWELAQRLWERIVEEQPADADAHLALATLHARLGRIEHARTALRRARQTDRAGKWLWEIGQTAAWLDEQAAVDASAAAGDERRRRVDTPHDSAPRVAKRTSRRRETTSSRERS